MSTRLAVIHSPDHGMDYADHPADRRRHQLAMALAGSSGLLDAPGVRVLPGPPAMPEDQLATMFAPAFIRAIQVFSARPVLAAAPEARQWGVTPDVHPYAAMHSDSARLAAAAWQAGELVGEGEALRSLVPAGGAHHGLPHRMSGFGVYNDTAVAILALRACGVRRIAYVDLDVHHGDGTQGFFWDDPDVLTVSVHESGRYLFPGSGFPDETGGPRAPGSAVNVALPPESGDDAYRMAMAQVIAPAVRAFAPDVLVTQNGVDHHHADPLSHLRTTMPLYPELWGALDSLADEVCAGRWVALAGGGYDPCNAPPRAWAMLMATMAGVALAPDMPEEWASIAAAAACSPAATGWTSEDAPITRAGPPASRQEVQEAIDATVATSPLLG
ncbi:MAG: acetoin utilization protein AcuC [Thermoleophilia bacterium]|nr:acetoin utilization protein AcuC [Thermoleophilia bacterium]